MSVDYNTIVQANAGRVFTFDEAIQYMKILDQFPTPIGGPVQWVNANTGKPVSIGYVGSSTPTSK